MQNKLPLIVMLWPSSPWLLFSLAAAWDFVVSTRIVQSVWEGEHIIILVARYTAHANKGGPLGCFLKKKRGRRWCHQRALSELGSEGGVVSSGGDSGAQEWTRGFAREPV